MFDKLLNMLKGSEPVAPLGKRDAQLAMAALLVRVARSDDEYAAGEISVIDQLLAARYALDGPAVAALRSEAEALESQAPDTVRFTRAIKDAVPYEDRQSVVRALWQVVLADGTRDNAEDGFMRLTANLLGVNDRDSALMRQQAQAQAQAE